MNPKHLFRIPIHLYQINIEIKEKASNKMANHNKKNHMFNYMIKKQYIWGPDYIFTNKQIEIFYFTILYECN